MFFIVEMHHRGLWDGILANLLLLIFSLLLLLVCTSNYMADLGELCFY